MVSCFCNSKGYSNIFVGKDILYKYTDPKGVVEHLPMCKNYEEAQENSLIFGKILCTKSIVILNLVIRFVVINISKNIGYKTNQDMFKSVTEKVFIA